MDMESWLEEFVPPGHAMFFRVVSISDGNERPCPITSRAKKEKHRSTGKSLVISSKIAYGNSCYKADNETIGQFVLATLGFKNV